MSTPTLWGRISAFEYPEKTETYLERSRDIPLDISISLNALWTQGGLASFRMLSPLSNRCRTARFLKDRPGSDICSMIRNPCPRLLELYLEVPDGTKFHGIEDLGLFPSLKSLTLIGDIGHLRFPKPFNLRKLGVGCDGKEFRLASLLELLAKIPLLEELEVTTPDEAPTIIKANPPTPVTLNHLRRLVFRGFRSDLPRILTPLVAHPNDTKIILTRSLSYDTLRSPPPNPSHRMFPFGMQLPTTSPPKFVRYRDVQDEDASESRFCIDLITVDGQHTSIENCYRWADSSLRRGRPFESEEPHIECLGFLRTLDLSLVERFCVEGCSPDLFLVAEAMGQMINMETLVLVNCYPYSPFGGLGIRTPVMRCPLLRRLVIRYDATSDMPWYLFLSTIENRAESGSPLERITLTSVFNEVVEDPEAVELLDRITKVTYDLGRNTFGWEWWKV